jgi:hypothetical protein
MKESFVLVVLLLVSTGDVIRAQKPERIRALDPWAVESLERVLARSPAARRLIQDLETSDLIVHVLTAPVMPSQVAGTTCFVAEMAGYRYVRVTLARNMTANERAAILGHELQHAHEIAQSAARTDAEVRRLYEAIGKRVNSAGHFETPAAAEAGFRVWNEIRALRRQTIDDR